MFEVTVIERVNEAQGIVSLQLKRQDGGCLPPFSEGAHIDMFLPNGLVRQYSLFNPSPVHHPGVYQVGILLSPSSKGGSRYIHEHLKVGDRLKISEPRNLFALEQSARHSALFAGGIGITPILCMAEALAAHDKSFALHYCSKSRAAAAFLQRLSTSIPSQALSTYFDDEPDLAFQVRQILESLPRHSHLYVCGPAGYMDHVLVNARSLGFPDSHLHREYFSGSEVNTAGSSFEVMIASTGQCIEVPEGQTVAQSLERAGVSIPLSCEQGVCGTCLVRVLEGIPDHQDMFLSDAEHARNDQFTPCCSRAKSARLVLDL